ncbi:MAG: hypothetical protein Q8O40_06970 [Chloroflexota bacterium]|nr:hypothetical protein [Chloroflexota bacterium]
MDLSKLGRRQILAASQAQGAKGVKQIGLGVGNLLNALFILLLLLVPLRVTRRLMAWAFRRKG